MSIMIHEDVRDLEGGHFGDLFDVQRFLEPSQEVEDSVGLGASNRQRSVLFIMFHIHVPKLSTIFECGALVVR